MMIPPKKWDKIGATADKAAEEIANQYKIRAVYALRAAFWDRAVSLAPKPLKREVERKIVSLANHARELKTLLRFCYPHIRGQLGLDLWLKISSATMEDGLITSISTEFHDTLDEYLKAIGNLNANGKTIRQTGKLSRNKFYSRLYAIYRQQHKNAKPKGLAFREFVYACSQAAGEDVSYETVERYLMSACIEDYDQWVVDIERADDPFK